MAPKTTSRTTRSTGYAWRCLECGHTFRSAAAAEKASYNERGCPGCGGTDFDESLPVQDKAEGLFGLCNLGARGPRLEG